MTDRPDAPPQAAPPRALAEPDDRWSWIWLVPLAAALLAAVLALQAWGQRGVGIRIEFGEGHGLKAGDVVRHRGIVVGHVDDVELLPEHDGVLARVRLDAAAADLARGGSRFWVVRPQLGLARVTGLDTLIGSRYLEVLPGRGEPRRDFVGLDVPPITEALLDGGLDLVLEGTHRGSLAPGSPVTYRKLRVGSVLAVGLSSDARTVEVRVRIAPHYAPLVRERTRFWDTSGLALDVGLTGVTLHLDTVQALLMGGVSLATPPDAGEVVATGHRFVLHDEADDGWLEWAPALPVGSSLLPPGTSAPRPLRAALTWTEGRFWSGEEGREGWVLAAPGGLLGPADLFTPPDAAHADSAALHVAGERLPLEDAAPLAAEARLAWLPGPAPTPAWPHDRRRTLGDPEDCLVVGDPSAPLGLAAVRLDPRDHGWAVDPAIPFDRGWHGACVVSRADGRLVGLLLVDDDAAVVVPVPTRLP